MSIDSPIPLKDNDTGINLDALTGYLRETLGDEALPVVIERFPRGFSNLTYFLKAGERELVLRRPPVGIKIASAHDMGREYRVMAGVGKVWDKVPEMIAFCEDESVLGAPFYLMERVRGVIFRDRVPKGMTLSEETMRAISTSAVDVLAQIHGLDTEAAGLTMGRPEGYAERQVSGWTKRYVKAKTDEVPDVESLAKWLAENLPAGHRVGLIHNDFKYDNIILDPDDLSRVKAVLDWEMATRGDPRMDLGSSLAYWIQADDPPQLQLLRFGITHLPGNLTREEIVDRYCEVTDQPRFDPLWYFAYGLFKLIVIAQQLYLRHVRGLTKEPRYAQMIYGVQGLSAIAMRAIQLERISDLN
ncbi:MAG: phosphotransferase family protein [Myxococcota bacterium]